MDDVVAGIAHYWEQLAPHRPGCSLDDIRAGRALEPIEIEALGDVTGLRVLHVACSAGDESLQLATAGAQVTGVDIAPSHVATARAKAAGLGVDADFRVADMTDLPPDLTGLDVVYVSWGGLCWVPDVSAWMAHVAARLAPGGRVVVAEHHPLWEILARTGAGDLHPTRSYTEPVGCEERDPTDSADLDKAPEVHRELADGPAPVASFLWNLGAVVTAMLDAGLTLTHLREETHAAMYPGVRDGDRLPAVYVAVGTRLA